MEYRVLGNTGERVSAIGLGTWQFSEEWGLMEYERVRDIVEEAVADGVNFFDTSPLFGGGLSEVLLGKALRELGVVDEVLVSTKVPGDALSEHDVLDVIKMSLKRLGTETVTLIQVHGPPLPVPTCTYMRALERAVHLGMANYIGLSNYPPALVEEARACLSREDVVCIGVRYNLLEREAEAEVLPYALSNGMSLLAWSPLARGVLTGKYRATSPPRFTDLRARDYLFVTENLRETEPLLSKLEEVASKYGKTVAQVALNWLLMSGENVLPVPGAKSREQMRENAGSVGWSLSRDDWLEISSLAKKVLLRKGLRPGLVLPV